MYEAHFGLTKRPFCETVDPTAFVSLSSHNAILRRLRYALIHNKGSAILFGPSGSGKTLLASQLMSELPVRVIHLSFPSLPPTDLVIYLAQELSDVAPTAVSLPLALRHLRGQFAVLAEQQQRPVLVVDDAHLISDVATFDTLRLMLNFTSNGHPDLSILLVGGVEALLDIPASLTDRLAAHCLLSALTEEESSAYLIGRLAGAGNPDPVFTDRARSILHHVAHGIPRRLNRLADLALLIAYAEDLVVVDEVIVRIAAREFDEAA
jgi:type II secretory pathway predicted ATPase ExeA